MKKKRRVILFIAFLWAIWPAKMVLANESNFYQEERNVIIVMDYSGSMSVQDKYRCIPQVFTAMLDILEEESIRVGFVAYNDTILTSYPLTSLEAEAEVNQLKENINKIPYAGETDIGLGLQTAYQMLEEAEGAKSILLLSDGETDLKASVNGRSKEESDKDVEEVINLCRQSGVSISTVAFGKESNKNELEEISKKTNGQSYIANESGELVTALADLFLSKLTVSLREMGSSIYGAGTQKISYENNHADSLTILLLSEEQLKEIEITDDGGAKGIPIADGNFAVSKIKSAPGSLTISFSTNNQQKVWVFVLEKKEAFFTIQWTGGIKRNSNAPFIVDVTDKEGNLLLEQQAAEEALWEVVSVNKRTGEETFAPVELEQGRLSGTAHFGDVGEHLLYLRSKDGLGDRYVYSKIMVENKLPESNLAQTVELFTTSAGKTINLQEHIVDSDGDSLTYSLEQIPEEIVEVTLDNNELTIKPVKSGSGEIKILVSDGAGQLAIELYVQVSSFLEKYALVFMIILIILGLIIWRFFPKKEEEIPLPIRIEEKSEGSFTGKLNAYFTRLPENMEEIPILTFALYPVREKKIVLKDMFEDYPELVALLELDKIYFFPSEKREMIFYQECQSTVMIGNALVCRRMQYVINYGNVIYITSRDGKCELEVHYIAMI